jgi:hypothetical protein
MCWSDMIYTLLYAWPGDDIDELLSFLHDIVVKRLDFEDITL